MGRTGLMDHESVAPTRAVERYLLGEMSPAERDQFEAHFFECEECADEVRTGSMFVENSRAVFEEDDRAFAPKPLPASKPVRWWEGLLRPAWGLAAAGALLAVGLFRVAPMLPIGTAAHVAGPIELAPGQTRGSDSTGAAAAKYKPGDTVVLKLHIEQSKPGPHALSVRDAAGKELTSVPVDLTAADLVPGATKEVRFSGRGIPAGRYAASLSPAGSERGNGVVETFYFTLEPN